jgi:squalene synthase HpnC
VASPATGQRSSRTPPDLAAVMAQARAENFPVASRVLPRATRSHLLALYGFCRLVDDLGDEAEGDRLALLDWAEAELSRASAGAAEHPVFRALTPTIDTFGLSLQPFVDLIEANRQDQEVHRYGTFEDLTAYCRLSAVPVGRLVLAVLRLDTPERIERADRVCIGLQLVEHLQDVAEDWAAGRLYLPLEVLSRHGCDPDRLLEPDQRPALCAVVAELAQRARALLAEGAPLSRSFPVRPRLAVAAFSAGGAAALDAIERARFDVVATRCRPRALDLARRLLGTVRARVPVPS